MPPIHKKTLKSRKYRNKFANKFRVYKLEKIERNISMIFKGKRFFKRMIKGDLNNILKKGDKCIVQRVTEESISYALFDSWKCFELWYKSLSNDERTFSE